MKIIDAHVHVFQNLQGFRGEGELYPIGNGKGRWANGDIIEMIPEGLGDKGFTYETCRRVLTENGVEKAVLLQEASMDLQMNTWRRRCMRIRKCLSGPGRLIQWRNMQIRFMTG